MSFPERSFNYERPIYTNQVFANFNHNKKARPESLILNGRNSKENKPGNQLKDKLLPTDNLLSINPQKRTSQETELGENDNERTKKYRKVEVSGTNNIVISILRDSQEKSNDNSLQSRRQAVPLQEPPNPLLINYGRQINQAAKENNVAKCWQILTDITNVGLKPNIYTYSPIIDYYAKNGDEERTIATYNQMKNAGILPNVVVFTSLINLFVKKEDVSKAKMVLQEMKDAAVQPNVVTFTSLINLLVRKKDVKEISKVLQEMKDAGVRPNDITYYSLIDLTVNLGFIRQAKNLFKARFSIADRIFGNQIDLHGFSHGAAYIAFLVLLESGKKEFGLITGKGLHSKSNEMFALSNYIKLKIEKNHPDFSCELDPNNQGILLVKAK